uniref:uncharacterized protein LOC122596994 n=1 Tax=Erigeron canadensis TaxID=72917 RepID=UPI001CB95FCA|nr:uncharacterized protein LOC122596994 [Erigeron canadensis]
MQWDVNPDVDMLCPFCKLQPDSHSHLFFECDYSMQVWKSVYMKAGLQQRSSDWNVIIQQLLPKARRKSMQNVLDKLLLAASVYFIWQERNARLFMQGSRNVNGVAEQILSTIRLKLLTFRYKRSAHVERLLAAWDLPVLLLDSN